MHHLAVFCGRQQRLASRRDKMTAREQGWGRQVQQRRQAGVFDALVSTGARLEDSCWNGNAVCLRVVKSIANVRWRIAPFIRIIFRSNQFGTLFIPQLLIEQYIAQERPTGRFRHDFRHILDQG